MFTRPQTEPTLDINYEDQIDHHPANGHHRAGWECNKIKYKPFFRQVRNEIKK